MESHHEGSPTYYDENGIKKEEAPIVFNKLHGMVMDYHENGDEVEYWKPPMWMAKSMAQRLGPTRTDRWGVVSYVNGKKDGGDWYHKNGSK